MTIDKILEIGIDDKERLFVKPQTQQFEFIYRDASGISWDNKERFLYSPKPIELTHFDWFRQILLATKGEYGCELKVTSETKWTNISEELKNKICGQ
ncbi:MAG: hypothetical protein MUC59_02550 [Saprospiraceae bacterium]|jgi:hypothetical protein|nr:hypothetical protein [Saprospiraceae bacterium]